MTTWSTDALARVATTDELGITTYRADGSLRPYVPIWVVRVGEDIYVPSYRGRRGGWFGRAVGSGAARIRMAGLERDVRVEEPVPGTAGLQNAIDDAYRAKYARYGNTHVGPMLGADATAATLRLLPT